MNPMKILLLAGFVAKFSTPKEIKLQPFSLTDYAFDITDILYTFYIKT